MHVCDCSQVCTHVWACVCVHVCMFVACYTHHSAHLVVRGQTSGVDALSHPSSGCGRVLCFCSVLQAELASPQASGQFCLHFQCCCWNAGITDSSHQGWLFPICSRLQTQVVRLLKQRLLPAEPVYIFVHLFLDYDTT